MGELNLKRLLAEPLQDVFDRLLSTDLNHSLLKPSLHHPNLSNRLVNDIMQETKMSSSEFDTTPNWIFKGERDKLLGLGAPNPDSPDLEEIIASRHARKPEIVSRLKLQSTDIVCDLGSGMGVIAEVIAPEVKHVHCCDISGEFLKVCKERTQNFDNIETHEIAYADLSAVEGKGVNKVYSTLLFIHFNFYDVVYYLQEINKVLDKDGLVLLRFLGRGALPVRIQGG